MMLALVDHKPVLTAENLEELMAEAENIYTDHFMPSDRRELIETGVKLAGLKEDFAELKRMVQEGNRGIHSTMAEDQRGYDQAHEKLDSRVRALENFRWWIVGAAAASGATAGFISRFFHTP